MFVDLQNLFPEESKTIKQKIMYRNVTEDLSMKKKNDIKLETLQLRKVQKMSTMLQRKTYIFLPLPTIKIKIKNGS